MSPKKQRLLARLDTTEIERAVLDHHEGDLPDPTQDCGGRCDLCLPDWQERDEQMRALHSALPPFIIAERLLAQAGLILRQVSP